MNRQQFVARIKAAKLRGPHSSPTSGGPSHAKARVWYSQTCPKCGKDTWGSSDGSAQIGIRLVSGQQKFRCRCGQYIDLRCYSGSC